MGSDHWEGYNSLRTSCKCCRFFLWTGRHDGRYQGPHGKHGTSIPDDRNHSWSCRTREGTSGGSWPSLLLLLSPRAKRTYNWSIWNECQSLGAWRHWLGLRQRITASGYGKTWTTSGTDRKESSRFWNCRDQEGCKWSNNSHSGWKFPSWSCSRT